MIHLLITRRFVKILLMWAMISVALLGVAADCSTAEGGMYQGGTDSEPGWRR